LSSSGDNAVTLHRGLYARWIDLRHDNLRALPAEEAAARSSLPTAVAADDRHLAEIMTPVAR
jgi:hypothetical protein